MNVDLMKILANILAKIFSQGGGEAFLCIWPGACLLYCLEKRRKKQKQKRHTVIITTKISKFDWNANFDYLTAGHEIKFDEL